MVPYDRYEYGAPNPQEEEPKELGGCMYAGCDNRIYVGEKNWEFDEEWFCSAICLAKYLGAVRRYAE